MLSRQRLGGVRHAGLHQWIDRLPTVCQDQGGQGADVGRPNRVAVPPRGRIHHRALGRRKRAGSEAGITLSVGPSVRCDRRPGRGRRTRGNRSGNRPGRRQAEKKDVSLSGDPVQGSEEAKRSGRYQTIRCVLGVSLPPGQAYRQFGQARLGVDVLQREVGRVRGRLCSPQGRWPDRSDAVPGLSAGEDECEGGS